MSTENAMIAVPEKALAGEASRRLAKLALSPSFRIADAIAEVANIGGGALAPTIAHYEASLAPLKQTDPSLEGARVRTLIQAFAPIGAKMRPDMGEHPASIWAFSIVKAMSDLPAFCIAAAFEEAIHRPFAFPTDMEAGVRECAERILKRHTEAIARLKWMMAEITGAATKAQRALEGSVEVPDLSPAELHSLNPDLRRMGLQIGSFTQADLDAADAQFAEGQ